MLFTQIPPRRVPPREAPGAFLVQDMWDDFGFQTSFTLWCFNGSRQIEIGTCKVACYGMESGKVDLPQTFERLSDRYFSLGVDESYYTQLRDEFDSSTRESILRTLKDAAFDPHLFEVASEEAVMTKSLLRGTEPETVTGQFHRIAIGGPTRSKFDIDYRQRVSEPDRSWIRLGLEVDPDAMPPTNVHALIGSNGVGKTHLLDTLARTVLGARLQPIDGSRLTDRAGNYARPFANLVSVGFSAFDALEPLAPTRHVGYQYVGLKKRGESSLKGPSELGQEFADSASACVSQGPVREQRWRDVLERLEETDPIFQEQRIALLAAPDGDLPDAKSVFAPLSSGHKIVLLTLARLVEHCTERTLVLVDEPEAHLHPPLLSTFIRVLSALLLDTNGVALIATHSPVVLQETPRRAVWALRRAGGDVAVDHPEIETFGENVGVITREIFGLEVTHTGFHAMIEQFAREGYTYEEILGALDDALGAEGRGLARVAARRHRDGTR
ncbi:AAA family ATPase [Streptomyces sp. NPDC059095]|nr:hypothetical protein CG740_35875 [Streptomyces sp. CB01201]